MATKKQIAQIMGGAINKAAEYLGLIPPKAAQELGLTQTDIDSMQSAALQRAFPEAQARRDAFFKQLDSIEPISSRIANIEPISIQIAKAIQATQSENGDNCKPPKTRNRIKHIPYKQALAILERLNCPKDRKTLLRWMKGENTPDGFTPETMATVQSFTAWATIYANREQSKINTNNTLRIDNPNSRKMQKFR